MTKRAKLIKQLRNYKGHLETRATLATLRANSFAQSSWDYEEATEATQTEEECKRLDRFCLLATRLGSRASGLVSQVRDLDDLIKSLTDPV